MNSGQSVESCAGLGESLTAPLFTPTKAGASKVCIVCGSQFIAKNHNREVLCSNDCKRKRQIKHRVDWSRRERNKTGSKHWFDMKMRKRVKEWLKRKKRPLSDKSKTNEMFGCSFDELRQHLEKGFKSGMSWSNYGYDGWHIDHIRPLASFDLKDPEQLKQCFHFSNLRPMWKNDNFEKSDKWDGQAAMPL